MKNYKQMLKNKFKPLENYFILPLLQAVFPSRCKVSGCGNFLVAIHETKLGICSECRKKILMAPGPFCDVCGRSLDTGDRFCGECILKQPVYAKHSFYARYEGIYKDLLLIYKNGGAEKLKFLFSECLTELFEIRIRRKFNIDAIVPVPRDKGRGREFDHMLEVARGLSRKSGIRLLRNRLVKVKKTLPQAGLSRAKRLKNLDGAFAARKPEELKGKTVLLLDDIYTTGTTIRRCTEVLSNHKATVVVLTLARP